MPWDKRSFAKKTRHADTPAKAAKGAKIANKILEETGDEEKALRIAKAAVKKGGRKGGRR